MWWCYTHYKTISNCCQCVPLSTSLNTLNVQWLLQSSQRIRFATLARRGWAEVRDIHVAAGVWCLVGVGAPHSSPLRPHHHHCVRWLICPGPCSCSQQCSAAWDCSELQVSLSVSISQVGYLECRQVWWRQLSSPYTMQQSHSHLRL